RRFRRDPRQFGVAGRSEGLHLQQRVDTEQQLPNDGEREVATWQLHQERVPELDAVAQEREIVLGASLALRRPRQLEKQRRLADQVERDVRERDVFLENRAVPAPLRQPVAEDQPVVAEAEEIGKDNLGGHRAPRNRGYTPRTPRGTL